MPATPPQMPALGFVGLGQYLDANRGVLADRFGQDQKRAQDTMANGGQQANQDLSRQFGSESALAGNAGGDPTSGANAFDAALEWGAYGPQYKTLSEHLDQAAQTPAPQTAPPIQTDPNGQQRKPTMTPPVVQGGEPAGAGEGTGGQTFTPAPSTDQPAGASNLRKALRQVGR